ncbi:restriction endonuclease subunit S [Escherichia coli]|nr:restriction endonuclease subunit S [Escherichia coli]
MSRWRNFCITELADFCNAQRIPLSAMERAHKKGNFPYYGASGIVDYIDNYIFDGSYILISEDGENLKSRKTPIAFEATGKFWVNNHAHVLKAKKPHLTALIIQYFSQLDLSPYLTGAAQPKLNKASLNLIPLYLPIDESEQKAIASILSSLKDKIDLLHRQNKTLESMAETLFRQWFIEETQEEWDTVPLSKVATFTNGLACQKFPAISGEPSMPVLKIKELSSGISSNTDLATANIKEDYIVNHGDVIFAWSASLMVKIWSGPVCVLNQHLFKVTSDTYPKWFYLEWCKHYLKEFISISQSHATTMGHIKRKDLDEAMVKIPSNNELVNMTAKIGPLLDQRIEKMRQIRTLETLRDTLLPKLMSGDVRVQYAEEAIASVA